MDDVGVREPWIVGIGVGLGVIAIGKGVGLGVIAIGKGVGLAVPIVGIEVGTNVGTEELGYDDGTLEPCGIAAMVALIIQIIIIKTVLEKNIL